MNNGPVARYLTHLEDDVTAKAKAILGEAEELADALGLDDEVMKGLVDRLKLE